MNIPDHLKYTQSHEWVRVEGAQARVGVTDHAQAELSDVVFVELPKVGARLQAGSPAAVVESVKAAGDIYSPVTGAVTAVNEALAGNPALVNADPYEGGWLFTVELENPAEAEGLKNAAEYQALIGG